MREKVVLLNHIMLIRSHSVSTPNNPKSLKESINEISSDYPDSIDDCPKFFLRFFSRSKPKYQMQIL